MTESLHQVGMHALSHTDLAWHGLAWCSRQVKPSVQLWQLLCQAPNA